MTPFSTPYYYKVFGLKLASAIPLNELIEIAAVPNPEIVLQFQELKLPILEADDDLKKQSPIIWLKKGFFFLTLKDIANFQVEKTETTTLITIDILDKEAQATVMAFLYGSILTVALQMNNLFALHASAISHNGRLSLFAGRSGIGKSTLAAQLHTRGYGLFSDDKCILNWSDKQACYLAEPSIQIIRLWQDALDNLDSTSFLGNKDTIIQKVNKYQFQLDTSIIMKATEKINSINIIRNVTKEKSLKIKPIVGMKKLKMLRLQTHRFHYLSNLEKIEDHWNYINHLAQHIPVNLILRPEETPIHLFADFIETHIILKSTTT